MFNQVDLFDVLVVYSKTFAKSASSHNVDDCFPFSVNSCRSNYNDSYAYFLSNCKKNNLEVAFTTSADIIGAGMCNTYWIYRDKHWIKNNNNGYSQLIFDKFSPLTKKLKNSRNTLFSNLDISAFNDSFMFDLFFDKLKSFRKFENVSIPTVEIKGRDICNINLAVGKLEKLISRHEHKEDFGKEIILKDRFGSGGFEIYRIDKDIANNIRRIVIQNKSISFVIQPYTKFDLGFKYKNQIGAIDLRLIFMGKKIIQTYIRTAKENDFRCNQHQGGLVIYINKRDVPIKVIKMANIISKKLNKPNSLYALDFIVSNNGNVYFLEGNSGPGIIWDRNSIKDQQMAKKLMRTIVKELKRRVKDSFPQTRIKSPTIPFYQSLN